jgi:uncharacterized protein (DUF2147 family)
MKKFRHLATILCVAAFAFAAHAQAPSPVGDWRTFDDHTGRERSLVRISDTPQGLSARILATTDPKDGEHVCVKCEDDRKGQPILGLEFMRGMQRDGDEWNGGRILDPESGAVYRCEMHLEDGGRKLVLRGYIGFSFIGRSQTWLRAG